ncbi:MAG TPA: peptidase S10 [Thermoanaerobaculia bacterium]|nr:peptidase S10 [Thermoanaerobaculia bacterium]
MRNRRTLLLLLLLALWAPMATAQPPAENKPAEEKEKDKDKKPPEEKISTTRHTITLDGQKIAYTATAGNLVLKDDEGKPKASVFFVAYTRDGVKDPAERPVTFSFNGGPGAASLWVHLGAFGPKRVERTDEGMGLPPPGRLIDNEYSILDLTDLVFIDPVSTGFSRPAPGEDPKQFHGVRQDIEWVAEFVRLWVTRNERWASPKLVAGESYGTTRAAGLAEHLNDRYGMMLNGVVLISSVLNWQNQEFNVGNDMAYILILPTYAAAAWYHKKLPPELSGDLRKTLDEVEAFALGDYASALMQGDRLPAERRREIAARLARYTGLSQDYVERTNLRVEIFRFTKELLRGQGKTIGRLDSRFTGSDLDTAGEYPEFDPSSASLDGPYAAAINDYLRRELGVKEDLIYERLSRKVWPWSWEGFENRYVNLAEPLRQAMTRNPDLKVLFTCGYYDLATPYFDSVFTADHLGLPESLRGNVRIAYFEAGHMMYIREADHAKLKKDIAAFLKEAVR